MAGATTRVAAGRRATPASPSNGGGSEDRTRTPVWAFRFRDGCRRRPSAGPSTCQQVRRAGLEPARPRGDLGYSQAGQPNCPTDACAAALASPTSPSWVAAATGCRSHGCGSGSCLMLSTIDFAPTPRRWGLGRERCPHGHMTVSPVPRCLLASRPGRGSGARGTFHDSHGRRDSNPQPPVLETGALPVELRPLAALGESC
jgi:hypothetical protein